MLISFNFPERQHKEIFRQVSPILKKKGIWHRDCGIEDPKDEKKEEEWPHVSLVFPNELNDAEKKDVADFLRNKKPTFTPQKIAIFEGRTTPYHYLVVILDKPKLYQYVTGMLARKFGLQAKDHTPHSSILKFKKEDLDAVKEVLPLIEKETEKHLYPFKSTHVMVWDNHKVINILEKKKLKSLFYDDQTESLSDWSGDFVRYTNRVQPFISKKPWHQDPMGLYFFPKEFRTKGSWHLTNKYLVNAQLKSNAKVMDISALSDKDMENIYDSLGISSKKWKEPTEYESKQEKFYRGIRDQYMGKQAKFSNDMRKIGYDAIFDDTGAVHNAEKQLIVFNPSAIKVTDVVPLAKGTDYIKKMEKIVKKEYADPEWPWKLVEEKWETRREYQQKIPILKLKYQVGDVLAEVGITYSQQPSEKAPGYYRTNVYTYPKDRGQETERIELEIRTDEPEQAELEHFQAKLREYIDKTMLKFKLQEPETEALDLGKLKSSFYEEQP